MDDPDAFSNHALQRELAFHDKVRDEIRRLPFDTRGDAERAKPSGSDDGEKTENGIVCTGNHFHDHPTIRLQEIRDARGELRTPHPDDVILVQSNQTRRGASNYRCLHFG